MGALCLIISRRINKRLNLLQCQARADWELTGSPILLLFISKALLRISVFFFSPRPFLRTFLCSNFHNWTDGSENIKQLCEIKVTHPFHIKYVCYHLVVKLYVSGVLRFDLFIYFMIRFNFIANLASSYLLFVSIFFVEARPG